jgi:hypothetical protein
MKDIVAYRDPLLGKTHETYDDTTAVARKQPARQWTDWVVMTWEAQEYTLNCGGIVGDGVFCLIRAL